VKYFISLSLFFILVGCSTIDESVFLSYKKNVDSNLNSLEQQMSIIENLGKEITALETAIGMRDISDLDLVRNSPYDVSYRDSLFFQTISEALSSIRNFNSLYRSYSSLMYAVASDNLSTPDLIIDYNNSLTSISESLSISNEIVDYSISASSLLLNFVAERFSYNQRIVALKNISENSEIILEIIPIYIETIDDLEFTVSDYYTRYSLAIENMTLLTDDSGMIENLTLRLLSLNESYQNTLSVLSNLKNNFIALAELEKQLYNNIQEENLGDEELKDFVIRNYELYEELNG